MFLCHNIWQQHFKTDRTVTLLIISLKSETLWGIGALNNLQYVLESVLWLQTRQGVKEAPVTGLGQSA